MDGHQLLRVVLSFGFVLALIVGIAWLAKYFKLDERLQGMGKRGRGSLSLIDSLVIDAKRRVVVVAHEKSQYVLLLGPNGDTLIETRPHEAVDAPA